MINRTERFHPVNLIGPEPSAFCFQLNEDGIAVVFGEDNIRETGGAGTLPRTILADEPAPALIVNKIPARPCVCADRLLEIFLTDQLQARLVHSRDDRKRQSAHASTA